MREKSKSLKTRKVGTEERKNVCPTLSILENGQIPLFLRSYFLILSVSPFPSNGLRGAVHSYNRAYGT